MHSRLLAFIGVAGLLVASPAVAAEKACCADQACCESAQKASTAKPCCQEHHPAVAKPEMSAEQVFWGWLGVDPKAITPARREASVWFKQPVRIGENILHGQYVIEHDNDRMAQGGPCTYIYAMSDRKNPVVAFHCVHLDRAAAKQNTVVLVPGGDGFQRMTEFQFVGEDGAHGLPIIR
jgi:hypothetical protein